MQCSFTLDFWTDDGWFVGKLREVPNVFSQGKSLDELKGEHPGRLSAYVRDISE